MNGMDLLDYKNKASVVIVFTGEGKGKTSAALGLLVRALGNEFKVAFIQFIKYWSVGEHIFLRNIADLYKDQLYVYKGGKGFYKAKNLSNQSISSKEHKLAAKKTYLKALDVLKKGNYDLVICDEINNAYFHKLLTKKELITLIDSKKPKTSLCLTGRNFPEDLLSKVDIATNMTKIKHHFDDHFIANKGIDF
jgi:cob(I)alamin adenosyltransferase